MNFSVSTWRHTTAVHARPESVQHDEGMHFAYTAPVRSLVKKTRTQTASPGFSWEVCVCYCTSTIFFVSVGPCWDCMR